jgi:hypothetical protein
MAAILSPKASKRFTRALALDRVRTELEAHLSAPDPISSFFCWNRTRREIALAPYGLLANVPVAFAPYLDYDVFDHLTSLPLGLMADREFHDDSILRGYPTFSHVSFGGGGKPRPAPATFRHLALKTGRFLASVRCDLFDDRYLARSILTALPQGTEDRMWFLSRVVCLVQLESLTRQSTIDRIVTEQSA